MKWLRRVGNAALTLAAVVGVLGGALFVAVQVGALQTLVVTSGSMSPMILRGDALIAHKVAARDLAVGDVVTVPQSDASLVTHRVVAIEAADAPDARTLTLQGDANDIPDASTYTVSDAWRMWLRVPAGGAIVTTARQPQVLIPAAVGMGALVALACVPTGKRDEDALTRPVVAAPEPAPDSGESADAAGAPLGHGGDEGSPRAGARR
ncbi:signal peptidase I [Xylanimonas ulmi]|uniref:Signal peptidase I n=1 Tax=Xylanimonas ulmi TaxID=228973 RepID=A0A4V2EY74_9MICO|nr:signal peptidase I [Xylanibacterium ulmi]RZS62000.1 signal peptidase [Xylanibacterium ulmi]